MLISRSFDLNLSRENYGEALEKPMSPLTLALLCADGAVLLTSVRRQYFRVEQRNTLDVMVCMVSSTTVVTYRAADSSFHAAADALVHVLVACCLCARVGHALLLPSRASWAAARHG